MGGAMTKDAREMKQANKENLRCTICKEGYEEQGHIAFPFQGRCCDWCHAFVILARARLWRARRPATTGGRE
jgi:hypothetical protein